MKTIPRAIWSPGTSGAPPLPALAIPVPPVPATDHDDITTVTDGTHDEGHTVPTDLLSPVALDGNATVAITEVETPLLSSANESVSTSESVASPPRTRVLVINGSARTVCNGPICRVQKKDPPRSCCTCSYQYCKKCCLHYQEKTQKYCKEARHAYSVPNPSKTAPTTTSPLASETGTGMTMTSEFQLNKPNPSNRPLHQEHYEAQQRSEREWRVEANRLTLQKAVEERLKRNVNICFWNSVSLDFVTHTC